jgi:hypothetical protein
MKISLLRGVVVGALALVGVSALPSNALAYMVDFGGNDANWAGETINNNSTATWTNADGSGVNVTLGATEPPGALLTLDPSDGGVGINSSSYEYDEVEGAERLTITFSAPVTLSTVYLVDLFREAYNSGGGTYPERGSYQIDSNDPVTFSADWSQTSKTEGSKTLEINQLVTTTITFNAPGYTNNNNRDNEFAVAKITFKASSSSVPELDARSAFGAIGLLFAGLMVGTSRRRRLHARPSV